MERSVKMLVVDDDTVQLGILAEMARKSGIETDCAETVEDALIKIVNNTYDFILSDSTLDEKERGGIDLLKAAQEKSKVPFAIMSGYGDAIKIKETLDAGAIAYIVKPVNPRKLFFQISKTTLSDPDDPAETFRLAGLEFEKRKDRLFKLLVVEDDTRALELIADAARQRRIETDCAETVEDALVKIENNKYDFILSDLTLGENRRGAFDLLKAVRPKLNVPFVIMSGNPNEKRGACEEFFRSGATAFTPKPFDLVKLFHQISKTASAKPEDATLVFYLAGIKYESDAKTHIPNKHGFLLALGDYFAVRGEIITAESYYEEASKK